MIITIEETGEKFEAHDERIDQVFEEVKENVISIIERYQEDEKDFASAVLALEVISNNLKDKFSNMFGFEEILRVIGASEIE